MSKELPVQPQIARTVRSRELLDAETEQDRHARLGQLFSNISKPAQGNLKLGPGPLSGDKAPYAVPASDALARAKAFLPLLQSSNAELLERAKVDPNGVNIEHTGDGEQVVAMDLGLGVYDVHGEAKGNIGPEVNQSRTPEEEELDEAEDLDEAHLPIRIVESDVEDAPSRDDSRHSSRPDLDEAIIATPFVGEPEEDEVAILPPMIVDDRDLDLADPAEVAHSGVLIVDEHHEELEEPSVDRVADSDSDVDPYSMSEPEDPDSDSMDYSSMSDDFDDDEEDDENDYDDDYDSD